MHAWLITDPESQETAISRAVLHALPVSFLGFGCGPYLRTVRNASAVGEADPIAQPGPVLNVCELLNRGCSTRSATAATRLDNSCALSCPSVTST